MAPATTAATAAARRAHASGVAVEEPFLLARFSSPVPSGARWPGTAAAPANAAAAATGRRTPGKKGKGSAAAAAAAAGEAPLAPLVSLSAVVDNTGINTAASTRASSTDDDDRCPDLVLGVAGEGIHTFNTASQKRTKSYPAPPGFRLRGSARAQSFAKTTNIYAALDAGPVQDIAEGDSGRVVWRWEETERDGFGNKTTIKLTKPIHSLDLSRNLSDKCAVVVQEDGSLTLVLEDFSRTVASCDAPRPGLRVAWSTTHLCGDNVVRVFVVLLDPRGTADVAWYDVDAEGASVNLSAIGAVPSQDGGTVAVAYAFEPSMRQFSLISARGELVVYRLDIRPGKEAPHFELLPVEMLRIPLNMSVVSEGETSFPPASCALAVAGPSYLAVLVPSARARSAVDLSIWDVRHGTVQAETTVRFGVEDRGNAESRFQLQLCAVAASSRLVAAVTRVDNDTAHTTVAVCGYECQPVSLLGALGMMRLTRPHIARPEYDGNVEDALAKAPPLTAIPANPKIFIDEWKALMDTASKAEKAVADQILALLTAGNVVESENVFFSHVRPRESVSEKMDTPLSSAFAARIVRALFSPLSDKQTQPATPQKLPHRCIVYMFENGYIRSCDVDGGLLRRLVAVGAWELLIEALKHVNDIPEIDLVYLIRVLLISDRPGGASGEKLPCYDGPLRPHLLRLVASAPRNDVAMLSALATLPTSDLVAWLAQIVQWLDGLRTLLPPAAADDGAQFPPLADMLDHAILVLDAKFPSLVLSPEVHAGIEALSAAANEHVALCEAFEALCGPLSAFRPSQERCGRNPSDRRKGAGSKVAARPPGMDVHLSSGVGAYSVEILRV